MHRATHVLINGQRCARVLDEQVCDALRSYVMIQLHISLMDIETMARSEKQKTACLSLFSAHTKLRHGVVSTALLASFQ